MATPIGTAVFPGVDQIVGATATMVHGISPAVIQLQFAPQQDFAAEGGTFSILFSDEPDGGSSSIQYDWPDCKVDKHSFRRGSAGENWTLEIWDRRWKWAFGFISGNYNLRAEEGALITDREKTPKELIELCLDAMGEVSMAALLDDVPPDPRPLIEWDYENPAEAMAALCDLLGLRVVLQLNNEIAIRVAGAGAQVPSVVDNGVLDNSLTIDPPEVPDKVTLVGGITRHQLDIPLEAVAMDTEEQDNEIKLLDDVSYAPANGWGSMLPPYWLGLDTPEDTQALAKKWVFRAYRIKVSVTEPLNVPGYSSDGFPGEPITDIEQLLPLFDVRAETSMSEPDEYLKAGVYGKWFPEKDDKSNTDNAPIDPSDLINNLKVIYHGDFTIDRERGIVMFEDYVYANSDDTGTGNPGRVTPEPAELWLRTSVPVRDLETWGYKRYEREREVKVNGTPVAYGTEAKVVRQEEVVQTFVPVYAGSSYGITSVTTNDTKIEEEADHYIDATEAALKPKAPETIKYAGILDGLELDGAITQVTFGVGSMGTDGMAVTTVSRNEEQIETTISYDERRRIERSKRNFLLARKLAPTQLKQAAEVAGVK